VCNSIGVILTLSRGVLPLLVGVIEEKSVIIPENWVKRRWIGEVVLLKENKK